MSIGVRATLAVIKYILRGALGQHVADGRRGEQLSDTAQSFTLWVGLRISGGRPAASPTAFTSWRT
jgi:hypothetical protein